MRFQKQTTFGGPDGPAEERGNCFAACIASTIDFDLAEVPNFCADPKWFEAAQTWVRCYGLALLRYDNDPFEEMPAYQKMAVLLALGPGPRGHQHCVLWLNGEMLFDPHPSNAGLIGPPEEYHLLLSSGVPNV